MQKITLLIIPSDSQAKKTFIIPRFVFSVFFCFAIISPCFITYLTLDYLNLRELKKIHELTLAENRYIKGEAKILMNNLDEVKKSLHRINNYAFKLSELVNAKIASVSEKTGIGPLSEKEFSTAKQLANEKMQSPKVPLGINLDQLIFKPILAKISDINHESTKQAIDLQQLLSTLAQKKSLLNSIPTMTPVRGWITSDFGWRTSPFTSEKTLHNGIDIAAPVGAPIYAPADGVVIFSGAKDDFGNFIMIAHYGSGIVTRYGHNAENMVYMGQKIKRGEVIASVGMSGRTTGPHLHYEIYVNGAMANPRKFILDHNFDPLTN